LLSASKRGAYILGAIANLEELVSPLTEDEFLELLRHRKLALLRGTDADRYSSLLSWDALKGIIERGEHSLEHFRVTKEKTVIPSIFYLKDGKLNAAKLEVLLSRGASIIIPRLEQTIPSLAALCDNIKSRLSEQIEVGAIVTTGVGGALELHYDPEDLIILQVEGTKRWQIYGPAVVNPVRAAPKELLAKEPPPKRAPIFDEFLGPGDFLFVPGGSWHQCENGPGRSIHLGIFFVPPSIYDAIKAITSQILLEEISRVPLTRLDSPSELTKLQTDLIDMLNKKIGTIDLKEFIGEWTRTSRSRQ
jgi:ribosomal protein L16 Arg81 hydroxylase